MNRKVIDLGSFRSRRTPAPEKPILFYAHDSAAGALIPWPLRTWRKVPIGSVDQLRDAVSNLTPDLVILDRHLSWLAIEDLVNWLAQSVSVPIVMIAHLPETPFDAMRLKHLYALGLHDVITPAYGEAELEDTLALLLKFSRSVQRHTP